MITFDNRGIARSSDPGGPFTIPDLAEDTICLMKALGIEQAHVLGLSLGGMIAQELAINYPQRVMKLVLACTYASQDETKSSAAAKPPAHATRGNLSRNG
jgi:pimeloyl-ACP methyl ester carboxylesterase